MRQAGFDVKVLREEFHSGAKDREWLPVATANELQFSRENVGSFQPAGLPSSKEWIQVNRADAADYARDVELFQAAHEFVKGARGR